jgi:glucosamine-6-phosphate deaminase
MRINVCKNSKELGKDAARYVADLLNEAITTKGKARILLSTGASQFDTLSALVKENVCWKKVEMFHLDEYIGLPDTHIASFRKYLKERFINLVPLKKAYLVDGEGDVQKNIQKLTNEIRKEPIDVGLIGIGENAHIAFNDPPADFDTKESYIVVNLDDKCKMQQVREGWFPTENDVPMQAISMTVYQIMQCSAIVSCVPHKVKGEAIKQMVENDVTNKIPATIIKTHPNASLFLDEESAYLLKSR